MSKEKNEDQLLYRSPHYISWPETDWSKPLTEEDELMVEVLWDPESEKGMLAFEKLKHLRQKEDMERNLSSQIVRMLIQRIQGITDRQLTVILGALDNQEQLQQFLDWMNSEQNINYQNSLMTALEIAGIM